MKHHPEPTELEPMEQKILKTTVTDIDKPPC